MIDWIKNQYKAVRRWWRPKRQAAPFVPPSNNRGGWFAWWRPRKPSMPPAPGQARRGWFEWRRRRKPVMPPSPIEASKAKHVFILWRPFYAIANSHLLYSIFTSVTVSTPMEYLRKRDWRRLLIAFPALLAIFGLIGMGIALGRETNDDLAAWYFKLAVDADHNGDKQAATSYAEATVRVKGGDSSSLTFLARVARDRGDVSRAMAIYNSLAPPDQYGNKPAHLELAKLIPNLPPTPENLENYEKHLLKVVDETDSSGVDARSRLADFYLNRGRIKEAIKLLEKQPARTPQRLQLALALSRLGTVAGEAIAEHEAKGIVDLFEERLQANPNDLESRRLLVNCYGFMKEFEKAIRLAEGAFAQKLSNKTAKYWFDERTNLYRTWLNNLDKDNTATPTKRFHVLDAALKASPGDEFLLKKLIVFSDPKSTEGKNAREMLQAQLINGGSNSVLAHFILGVFYLQENRLQEARAQFQHAYDENAVGDICNNLAYTLAVSEPPELQSALKLADEAVNLNPNNITYLHTRGMIYYRMKEWGKLIGDLEKALDGDRHPDRIAIHRALADAYDKMPGAGAKIIADGHRAKMNEALKKNKK